MATATAAPQASYDEWRTRRWRLTSLAFALLWLVTAVAVTLTGEKQSDLNTLVGSIADGSVVQVEIVGIPPEPGWRGRERYTVKWRGRVLERFAEVTVGTRRSPGRAAEGDRILGDPATYLRGFDPDVRISYSDPTGFQEWRGWRAPSWVSLLGVAAWFGTVLLAGSGLATWRATPWAWVWLILFGGPLGSVAFLLLGGPLRLWRPRDLDRRLTGGWAFLLAMIFLGGANAG